MADKTLCPRIPGMSPYALESLYIRLGRPSWYWPAVFAVLFLLLVAGSSVGVMP